VFDSDNPVDPLPYRGLRGCTLAIMLAHLEELAPAREAAAWRRSSSKFACAFSDFSLSRLRFLMECSWTYSRLTVRRWRT